MVSLIKIIRFLIYSGVILVLSSFSTHSYGKGDIRYFPGVETGNASTGAVGEINSEVEGEATETPNSFSDLLEQVIEEDRFVDKLDSSSFFSLPVGISVFDGAYSLIVYNSVVYNDHAEFDAFLAVTNPLDGKRIYFEARNVAYSFSGGISSFQLGLGKPEKTSLFNGASLEWKPGTYAQWDCNGFDHIGLNASLELDSTKFAGVDPVTGNEKGSVRYDFFAKLTSINDFVLDVTLPALKIKGFDEAYFELTNAVLDFSDLQNAPSFQLPAGYPGGYSGETENLWRGVYVNQATVYLSPKFRKANQGSPVSFTASGLILDDFGFTGTITAGNILSLGEGALGNWPFSINSLSIGFFTGAFQSFGFSGGVKLPGSNTELDYSACFDVGGTYHFGITSAENIDFSVFSAKVELYSTSRIDVFIENGAFVPTALLDGKISFACTKSGGDHEIVKVPELDFQGMRLSAAPKYFDIDYLALEGTGENSLAKFPVTLNGIEFQKQGNLVGFAFDVNINLSPVEGCGINGRGDFSILADISDSRWQFRKLDMGYFKVDAQKEGAFGFRGSLELFNDDPVYGDAFYGQMEAQFANTFNSESLKLSVAGLFGKASFGRYFFVDAFVALGSAGIPAGPFVVNGFGGGLSYGMKRTFEASASENKTVESVSGVRYLPDESSGLGISAALQAGIVNEKLIKGSINFGISFNRHGGINQISFYGEAAMIAAVESLSAGQMKALSGAVARGETPALETSTPMKASVKILMDFQQNTFDAELEVWINIAGVFKGVGSDNRAGWAEFHSEPGTWHLYVGTPTDPVGIEFVGLVETNGYFMAGHDLPAAMMMNEKVLSILGMTQEEFNGQRSENSLNTGDGLAFGTNFEISTGDLKFLIFYASFDLGAGFDVMLLDMGDYAHCAGRSGPVGINGWYAKGQAYAYFSGQIGIEVKVFGRHKNFDIINVQTAAAMRVEGPNPVWLKGVVGGRYRILGGLVSGNCKFEATVGTKCDLRTGPEKLSDLTIIGDLTPSDGSDEVDIFTLPQVVFNMPVDKDLKISEDENLSREFRINLEEYSIYQGDKKVEGKVEWNPDKTTLAFTPNVIFDPSTEYKAVAKVSFDEKIDGAWQQYQDEDGKIYVESKEVDFVTGKLPGKIPGDYIAVTYPVDRMTNFYKNEAPDAYIVFKSDLAPFFYKVEGWEQKACWFPTNGGTPIYADFTYNRQNKEVVTSVPATLVNEIMYRFELVNVPLSGNNEVDRNVSESSQSVLSEADGSTTEITTRKAEGVISEQEEKVFYSLDFRSSKYNKFLDKIPGNQLNVRFLYNYGAGIDFPGATIYDTELFDACEIGGGAGFGPLIRCSAPLAGADWYREHIYPLLYEGYPWHENAVVERNVSEYGMPPTLPVEIWQVDFDYTLTDDDIETGTLGNEPEFAHFIYAVPMVWAHDFSEIRNNIALHVQDCTPRMEELLRRDIWPQVDMGTYPIKLEYVLPGKNKVTSSKVVNLVNTFDVPQVETFTGEGEK